MPSEHKPHKRPEQEIVDEEVVDEAERGFRERDGLKEQLEASQANERHLTNLLDWRAHERDENFKSMRHWHMEAERLKEQLEAAQAEAELKRIETHHANAKRQSVEEQLETQSAQIEALLRVVGDYEQRLGIPTFMRWQMPYGTGGNLSESYPASEPDA